MGHHQPQILVRSDVSIIKLTVDCKETNIASFLFFLISFHFHFFLAPHSHFGFLLNFRYNLISTSSTKVRWGDSISSRSFLLLLFLLSLSHFITVKVNLCCCLLDGRKQSSIALREANQRSSNHCSRRYHPWWTQSTYWCASGMLNSFLRSNL